MPIFFLFWNKKAHIRKLNHQSIAKSTNFGLHIKSSFPSDSINENLLVQSFYTMVVSVLQDNNWGVVTDYMAGKE